MEMRKSWSPEHIKILKKMWLQGKSVGEICEVTGKNRNQVVGKAHYLKLGTHPYHLRIVTKQQERNLTKSYEKTIKIKKTLKIEKPRDGGLENFANMRINFQQPSLLAKAKDPDCRYIIGPIKQDKTVVCGRPIVNGSAWCETHFNVCFQQERLAK